MGHSPFLCEEDKGTISKHSHPVPSHHHSLEPTGAGESMRPRGPDICDFRIALFALFLVAGPARLVGAGLGERLAMEAAFLAEGKEKPHVKQAAQLRSHVSQDLEKMLLRDGALWTGVFSISCNNE